MIAHLPNEYLWMNGLPVLQGLDGCSVIQRVLRYVVIVRVAIALERDRQYLLRVKTMARQYVTDPAVEASHHTVGLRAAHQRQPVLATRLGAGLVKDRLATRGAPLALEPVDERLVVLGE